MYSSAIINATNELNVMYNTPYIAETLSVVGNALITTHKSLPSSAQIKLLDELFAGTAVVPTLETLKSFASVNENLSLDIILGILQSPRYVVDVEAVQDAYTRQSRPYNNFGHLLSLAVGQAAEGGFYTYIDFDLTDIINLEGNAIWSIDLKLSSLSSAEGVIDVYENYSSWSEGFIMWVSQMNISEEPIFSFNSNAQIIDITELIKYKISNGETTFKIVLKSDDFIVFNSKEAGDGPKLRVTYSEADWKGYIGNNSHPSNAIIVSSSRKLLHSNVSISGRSDKISSAVLREKGLFNSEATIKSPLLYSFADFIAHWDTVNASAIILQNSNLASVYDKNATEANNSALLLTRKLFPSSVQITSGEEADWKLNEVTIKATGNSLNSEVIVPFNNFIPSSAIINGFNLLLNNAGIVNPNFPSNAIIHRLKDIHSEASIMVPYYEGIDSEAIVKYFYDTMSSVIIRKTTDKDAIANAIVRNSDLYNFYSEAYINYHSELMNEVIVRVNDLKNLWTNAIISVSDSNEFGGEATLNEVQWTPNEALINETKHMLSEAQIRIPDDSFFQSLADIYRTKDISSEAKIHKISDMFNTVIIRESEVRLLHATAELGGWHPYDTTALADILGRGNSINGIATIRTDARLIVPPHIDGRLPRPWKWEDYFPPA